MARKPVEIQVPLTYKLIGYAIGVLWSIPVSHFCVEWLLSEYNTIRTKLLVILGFAILNIQSWFRKHKVDPFLSEEEINAEAFSGALTGYIWWPTFALILSWFFS
jgi:hypothetical protein